MRNLLFRAALCVSICAGALNSHADEDDRHHESHGATLISLDPVAPAIRADEVLVRGSTRPRQHVHVEGAAADVRAQADEHGRFRLRVPLWRNRENRLTVSAGRHGDRVSVTVLQDSTPPTLSIEASADPLVFGTSLHLVGTATDAVGRVATVQCGPVVARLDGSRFSCELPLNDFGPHRLRIGAVDDAGNETVTHHEIVHAPQLPGGTDRVAMTFADLNAKDRTDLLSADLRDGVVSVRARQADGTLLPARPIAQASHPSALAVADVDGDGIADVLVAEYGKGEVAVWLGRADGTYVIGPRIAVGDFPSALIAADVDGDGRIDVITAHVNSGEVRVHLQRTDGSFARQTALRAGAGPVALALGDLDGDGMPDLVVANSISGDVSIFKGQGHGAFADPQRATIASDAHGGPTAVLIADVDGDGIADIVTSSLDTGDVTVLGRAPGSGYRVKQTLAAVGSPAALMFADVTGDALADLTAADAASDTFMVFAGEGHGTYSSVQHLSVLTTSASFITARPTVLGDVPDLPALETSSVVTTIDPFALTARAPAAGLPPPSERVGLTFGWDTSDYGQLLGPSGMSYVPLTLARQAGVRWIRMDADRGRFVGPNPPMSNDRYSALVDRFIAAGLSVHIIVTDFRWWPPGGRPFPSDFPTETYLQEYAAFAADLARATHRAGRVTFEVWNEPDGMGMFWPPQRPGVNEAGRFAHMLATVTAAIHAAVPDAVVISGGLTQGSDAYQPGFLLAYTDEIARLPGGRVNRFGLHPYPAGTDVLAHYRQRLDKAGFADLPIDATEVGGWWSNRAFVARLNAEIVLQALDSDLPHINFWAAISPKDSLVLAGFMDQVTGPASGCNHGGYGSLQGDAGYLCYASMYVLRTFDRVARGRTYRGPYFDGRHGALPGAVAGDELSGLRALKFESPADVVVAVYSRDRARLGAPGSGREYVVRFARPPSFAIASDGAQAPLPAADGSYRISHFGGPVYFFFSKSGQPPVHTVNARAVCANGITPHGGQLQFWYAAWPNPPNTLDWRSPGIVDAAAAQSFSQQLPEFVSNLYVVAEVAPDSGRVLPMYSSALAVPVAGAPTVRGGTFFKPPTSMASVDAPSTANATFDIDFLAPPEWCAP